MSGRDSSLVGTAGKSGNLQAYSSASRSKKAHCENQHTCRYTSQISSNFNLSKHRHSQRSVEQSGEHTVNSDQVLDGGDYFRRNLMQASETGELSNADKHATERNEKKRNLRRDMVESNMSLSKRLFEEKYLQFTV